MRLKASPLVVLVGFLLALCVSAQDRELGTVNPHHVGPEAPSTAPFYIDWEEQARLANADAAWREFRDANDGWRVVMDPRTRTPRYAFGPGIATTRALPSHDEVGAAALNWRQRLAPLFRIPVDQLELKSVQDAGRIWFAHFEQRIAGLRVDGATLKLRFDKSGRLVFFGGTIAHMHEHDALPFMPRHQAIDAAARHLVEESWVPAGQALEVHGAEPVIRLMDATDSLKPVTAWRINASTKLPIADWVVYIDSTTGAVLQCWNDVRECSHDDGPGVTPSGGFGDVEAILALANLTGTVQGTTHEGLLPSQAPTNTLFPDVRVFANGVAVITDAAGAWSFNGGAATVPVTCALDGPWETGTSSTGTIASFSNPAVASGNLDIVFTDVNSNIGERDMVFFANKAHRFLKLRAPTNTSMDVPVVANANLTSGTCNAFYSPSANSINFYAAGGACINTGTSASVVEHEYGHGVTIRTYAASGLSVPGHLGEGYGDCIGGACEDTAIVGNGFSGVGTMVRNMDNTCMYPSSCGTEIHARGLVIGGCYWHTRVQFSNAFGAAGKVQMDEYLFQHFAGCPQSEPDALMDMLLLDDNDGNVANGTPNLAKFYQGFTTQHGVPFPLPLVSIAHTQLFDTLDQYQPYEVQATATPMPGASVSSMTLFWRNGSAAPFTQAPMATLGAGLWRAAIPVQPSNSIVQYYMRAIDSTGIQAFSPAGAPTGTHVFRTSRLSAFVADGFETPSGWTHAMVAAQDDWHNNVHGNPAHAYDPGSAYQGVLTWGNDLVPAANWNGLYAANCNNNLTSPTYNCSGRTGVNLVYRRWLTVEDAVYDHARIKVSNNGGATWTIVWENPVGNGTQDFLDTTWVEHTIPIGTWADNQANVKLRWEITADAGLQYGGWNIDDLRLTANTGGTVLTSSGSSAVGQTWTLHFNGLANDIMVPLVGTALQGTFYPGIGSLSLDVFAPTTLVLPNIMIPAGGQVSLPLQVPNLIGLQVHFQAVVVPQATPSQLVLSNVVSVTITP